MIRQTRAVAIGTLRFLSLDWIAALGRAVAADERLRQLAGAHEIGLTQVVAEGPEGEVTYHLQVGDSEARFGPGAADPEHVRMEQSWETAVAVATGALNAQEAFVSGRIRLYGDQQRLLDAQPVFGALDHILATLRERTEYV
jgi:SCP-2 sterol transfer family